MASYDDSSDILDPPASPNGQLLVPTSRHELAPLGNWPPLAPPGSESLTAAPTLTQLLHCLRRRWPVAAGLALVFGGLIAVAVYVLVPVSFESAALLRVNRTIEGGVPMDPDTYNTYRKTQVQLVKSVYVLSDAIKSDTVKNLKTITEQNTQPSKWLERNLRVEYPGDAELMQITLRGDEGPELPIIVNAVRDSYLKLIVNRERDEKSERRERLSRQSRQMDTELTRKDKSLRDLIEGANAGDSKQIDTQRNVLITYLAVLRGKIAEADSMVLLRDLELQAWKTKLERTKSPAPVAEAELTPLMLERLINDDSEVRTARARREEQVERIALIKSKDVRGDKAPEVLDAKQKIQGYDAQIDERTAIIKPQLIAQFKAGQLHPQGPLPEESAQANIEVLTTQIDKINTYLAKLQKEYDDRFKEAQALGSTVLNLEQQRSDIDSLKQFNTQLKRELFNLDVELQTSVNRVIPIEDAKTPDGSNAFYRAMLIAFGALAGVGLAIVSVVFGEFPARRINSAGEIHQGLALKVLGTLPSRRRSKGNIVAESIDSVRTMLLKGGGPDAPHVVLVTSAVAKEGKTTVASQLAASLARSGRRTLLIDGDLRQPVIHQQFNVPLENGLCEVLRREVDLDDAMVASMIADLWIMPAGMVDQAAIMALSRDGVQEIFRRLRAKYDFIVMDSGPVLTFADTLLLGHFADATIMSVRRDLSQMSKVYEARERLEAVNIRVLGAVVNGVKVTAPRGLKKLTAAK